MIFYILILILFMSCSIFFTSNKYLNIFLYILLFLISAIRFDVGYDYISYYYLAKTLNGSKRIEFMYKIFLELSHFIKYPQMIFIITSFLSIMVLYISLKNYKERNLILMTFVGLFYLDTLSAQRYMLAYIIVFSGFKYIVNRNLRKYLIVILIAVLFHKMAIIGMIFYFFYQKISLKKIILLFFLITIFGNLVIEIVKKIGFYDHYFEIANSGGNKILIFYLILGMLLLILRNKLIKLNFKNNLIINIYIYSLALNIVFLPFSSIGSRLGELGYMYILYMITDIVRIFKNKNLIRIFITFTAGVIFVIYIYLGEINKNKKVYTPYKIFFLIDKIEFK